MQNANPPVVEWPQVADKVVTAITDGIAKAGGMAERLWPEVVRVYWAENLAVVIVWALVVTVFALMMPKLVRAAHDAARKDPFNEGEAALTVIPAIVVGVALLILGASALTNGAPHLAAVIAPEGALVKSLIEGALKK